MIIRAKRDIILVRKRDLYEKIRNGGTMEIVRNIYLDKLISHQKSGLFKVITGISRCGKSYLLFNLFYDYLIKKGVGESHIIEIPLDDRSCRRLRAKGTLSDYVKEKLEDRETYYIIIDEVQLLEDFFETINSLLDIKNTDIYITGSDLNFLYEEVMGRFDNKCEEIRIYPLSFRESIHTKDMPHLYEDMEDKHINEYIKYGGMPMLSWMKSPEEKEEYLISTLKNDYMPEIIEKYRIKNIEEFAQLIYMLAKNLGCLTNPLKLSNQVKSLKNKQVSDKTIKNYIDYLGRQLLINKVSRYDINKRKYISTPSKYYFEDIGLRNAMLDFKELNNDKNIENIIYNELRLRKCSVDTGVVEINIKDENGKNKKRQLEVDFVVNKAGKRYYIQSVYNENPEEELKQQEVKKKTLRYIRDSFKKIIVLGEDTKLSCDEYGIVTMGLKEFLLKENSLEL